jgi:hypothetical protein
MTGPSATPGTTGVPVRTNESGATDSESAGVCTRPGAELDIGDLTEDDGRGTAVRTASVTRVTNEA